MAREGTAGRTQDQQSAPAESAIDKAVKKTKRALDSDNKETDYDEATDEMKSAKDHSKHVSPTKD